MVEACSTYGGGQMHTGFRWIDLREGGHLEDPGVDGRIRLKSIFRKLDEGINWIDLAQDRDRWQAVMNVLINLRVP
jgi:hypothetical protein